MKKMIISIMVLVALSMSAQAGSYVWEGAGAVVTATTTPQLVLVPNTNYSYAVSAVNIDATNDVFWEKVAYGVETALVATNGFVAVDAMSIPAENSYTSSGGTVMNEENSRQIGGIVIATTNGTAVVHINFE
jgi:hypothetical protein